MTSPSGWRQRWRKCRTLQLNVPLHLCRDQGELRLLIFVTYSTDEVTSILSFGMISSTCVSRTTPGSFRSALEPTSAKPTISQGTKATPTSAIVVKPFKARTMPNFKALHDRIAPKSAGRPSQVDKENSIALANKSVNLLASKGQCNDNFYHMVAFLVIFTCGTMFLSTLHDWHPHSLVLGSSDGAKNSICSKKTDRKQSYLEGVKANRSSVIDGARKMGPFTSSS